MSDRDTITLPREVVEKAVKAFENGCPPTCEKGMVDSGGFHPWSQPALVPCPACLAFEHLRNHLAAEQPKPEPVAVVGTQSNEIWKRVYENWVRMPLPEPAKRVHLLRDLPLGTLLYTAPPDAEALRRDAFRKGFYAGFAATGEGWNGEYPFQDKNRPIAGDPSVEAAIDAAMEGKR